MNRGTTAVLAAVGGALALAGPAQAASCNIDMRGTMSVLLQASERAEIAPKGGGWAVGSYACSGGKQPRSITVTSRGGGVSLRTDLRIARGANGNANSPIVPIRIDLKGEGNRLSIRGGQYADVITVASLGAKQPGAVQDVVQLGAQRQPWITVEKPLLKLLIDGQGGDDTINASPTADTAYGRSIVLDGFAGNDKLAGGKGDDGLSGNDGRDELFGSAGQDVELGGQGDDVLRSSAGGEFDVLDGEGGKDLLTYEGHRLGVASVLFSSLPKRVDKPSGGVEDVVAGMETVVGTSFADRLSGSSLAETLVGGGGDDTIEGGAGDDRLEGGAGTDRLDGGAGANTCVRPEKGEQVVNCTIG